MKKITATEITKALEEITQEQLGIDTLLTQDNDSLDFHEVSVWSLKFALQAAYHLGRSDQKEAQA